MCSPQLTTTTTYLLLNRNGELRIFTSDRHSIVHNLLLFVEEIRVFFIFIHNIHIQISTPRVVNLVPPGLLIMALVDCPITLPNVWTSHSLQLTSRSRIASNTVGDVNFRVSVKVSLADENNLLQLTEVPVAISRLMYLLAIVSLPVFCSLLGLESFVDKWDCHEF